MAITGDEVLLDQEEFVSTRSDVELVATTTEVSEALRPTGG
jgi:hypothetical protein